ncbi:MAG: pyruvate kinase [Bacteroidetes bacterium]|nr:pyruvate kinase [Bacteroidota bacterium]
MKTKIVATIGPASSSEEMLRNLIINGVSVFRLNFSHSSYEDHQLVIDRIHKLNTELGTNIAILADLQGPKLRIGLMENGQAFMEDGHELVFTTNECTCNSDRLFITYPEFARDVKPGEDILLDDGKLLFRVLETNKIDEVKAKVIHGGILSSKKGVNLPNTIISLPSMTEKDLRDLQFALKNRVNWIALSFVRTANDIIELRKSISQYAEEGLSVRIIAKIEKPEAVKNMDAIVEATDGIMVARGDLGVELPLEQVPLVQKTLVNKCIKACKPVIIATQMMEGMISNIRPTRAEVNDVANSVLDGADALMLSGETSIGQYPVEVIQTMKKIIREVEEFQDIYNKHHEANLENKEYLISDSILFSACNIAWEANAKAILAMTHTGYSAFRISSQRPKTDVYIFSNDHELLCTLNLVWGINGIFFDEIEHSTTRTLKKITEKLIASGLIKQGDLLVNVASTPIYISGKTNMLKLSFA